MSVGVQVLTDANCVAIKATCEACEMAFSDWRHLDGDSIHNLGPMTMREALEQLLGLVESYGRLLEGGRFFCHGC